MPRSTLLSCKQNEAFTFFKAPTSLQIDGFSNRALLVNGTWWVICSNLSIISHEPISLWLLGHYLYVNSFIQRPRRRSFKLTCPGFNCCQRESPCLVHQYSNVRYLHSEQVLVAFIVQAWVHLTEISLPMISFEIPDFLHIGYICVRPSLRNLALVYGKSLTHCRELYAVCSEKSRIWVAGIIGFFVVGHFGE